MSVKKDQQSWSFFYGNPTAIMWYFHISYCTPLYGYAPEHIPKASIFTYIHWFLIVWRNTFHAIVLVGAIFTFRQIHVLFPMRIRIFTRLYPYATIYQSRIIRSGRPVGSLRHFLRCLSGSYVFIILSVHLAVTSIEMRICFFGPFPHSPAFELLHLTI